MLDLMAPPATLIPPQPRQAECRVYERLSCELPGMCQPTSAQGMKEQAWLAKVRDISQGGIGLLLPRRYERGAAA